MSKVNQGIHGSISEVWDEGYARSDEDAPNRIDNDIYGALNFLDTYFDAKGMRFDEFDYFKSWQEADEIYKNIIHALDNGLPITDPYILRMGEKEPPTLFSRVITKIKDIFGVSRRKN